MYNDFVIIGPKSDPAGLRGIADATAAFEKIAASKACFVTRGDKSGTHIKEMEIWAKAGMLPESLKDKWYITFEGGNLGNGPTTLYANEINAYTLMDRATFLIKKSSINLDLFLEKDTMLLNFFATIIVNPQKFPSVNASGAKTFVDWLCGYEAQSIIKDFEVHKYNEPLFFPNSDKWKRQHPVLKNTPVLAKLFMRQFVYLTK
jgi:tungstate transport system substrate-binding protein